MVLNAPCSWANPRLDHRLRQGRGNGFPHGWCHRGAVDRFGDNRRPSFGAILPASPGLSTASGVSSEASGSEAYPPPPQAYRPLPPVADAEDRPPIYDQQGRPPPPAAWGRRPTSRNMLHAIAAAVRAIPNPLHLRRARRTSPTPRTATRRCKLRRVTSPRLPVRDRITELPALRLNRARTNRMQRVRRCRSTRPIRDGQPDPRAAGAVQGDPRYTALPPEVRPETGPKKTLPPQFRPPWSTTTPRSGWSAIIYMLIPTSKTVDEVAHDTCGWFGYGYFWRK